MPNKSEPEEPSARSKTLLRLAAPLVILVALFGWSNFANPRQPGLYEDEAWSAVEAVRLVVGHRDFLFPVEVAGRAWPNMRNAYVGPLKTYYLSATFALFGVSETVLRASTA